MYDGDGNRVSKTVGAGATAVTTKFVVSTTNPTGYAQVVEEIISGSVQRTYVHGHSLISQTQLISGNWITSFFDYDGHGSSRFLTDPTGVIIDTYSYDAFGNPIFQRTSCPD